MSAYFIRNNKIILVCELVRDCGGGGYVMLVEEEMVVLVVRGRWWCWQCSRGVGIACCLLFRSFLIFSWCRTHTYVFDYVTDMI